MSTKRLKYHSEIQGNNCGLLSFEEHSRRIAYRWVFENKEDPRNFLPTYAIDEQKLKNDQAKGEFSCTRWALSFFKSEIHAKERFETMMTKNSNIYKKLGTHIARGYLNAADGISDECDDVGHFNHFEYEEVALESKFDIKSCLVSL
jgi:hypothetical protein